MDVPGCEKLTEESSYLSQNSSVAHFGLGTIATIDSVIVHWPSGAVETNTGIAINTLSTITEGGNIGLNEFKKEKVQLFPNPANEYLTILSSYELSEYTIYSLEGKEVINGKVNSKIIDLKQLNAGMYTIHLIGESFTSIHKIQVTR